MPKVLFKAIDLNSKMSITETAIKRIFTVVKDLRFGEVIIKVQDGHIVSVEKHEKIRIGKMADPQECGEADANH